jgi:RHS repeat-associated protein
MTYATQVEKDDTLRVMWRAYLDRRSEAQSERKSPSGVGKHVYIGQYADDQTSLDYLNARYYNATQGQFLSEDPVFLGNPNQQNLSDPQSLNTYSYSENNPITKCDPSGKCIWDACSVEFLTALGIVYTTYGIAQTSVDLYDAYITNFKYSNQFSTTEKLGTVGHLALDAAGTSLSSAAEHVRQVALGKSLDVTLSLYDALGALNTYFYGDNNHAKQTIQATASSPSQTHSPVGNSAFLPLQSIIISDTFWAFRH